MCGMGEKIILKLTNPKGAVILNGRRFERNTLGGFNRVDAIVYSHKENARKAYIEFKKHANLSIEVIEGEYW